MSKTTENLNIITEPIIDNIYDIDGYDKDGYDEEGYDPKMAMTKKVIIPFAMIDKETIY